MWLMLWQSKHQGPTSPAMHFGSSVTEGSPGQQVTFITGQWRGDKAGTRGPCIVKLIWWGYPRLAACVGMTDLLSPTNRWQSLSSSRNCICMYESQCFVIEVKISMGLHPPPNDMSQRCQEYTLDRLPLQGPQTISLLIHTPRTI